MTRFTANLSMLFTEVPFLERFGAAKRAGFDAVEYLFPYDHPAEEIAGLLREHRLEQVLFNLPAGDWGKGERGIACHPDRMEEFRAGVDKAIAYAKALGCKQVNCLAGIVPAGVSAEQARTLLIGNLRFAAKKLEEAGILLLIEPINHYDIPGFCVTTSAQGVSIIDEVGSPNLKLQYDIYHMQRMEGELAETMQKLMPRIAHIQLADNPGRNEPGTGEINYPFLFGHLARLGYSGWIGCEYKPKGETNAGLGWMKSIS